MKKKLLLILIHVILPILLGGSIYILFRSKSLIMFNWLKTLDIFDSIKAIRDNLNGIKESFPKWMIFSFPDALWTYSFTSAILIFDNIWKINRIWLVVPFVLGLLIELFQLYKLFPGTFDLLDILFSCIAFITSILIITIINFKHETKTF